VWAHRWAHIGQPVSGFKQQGWTVEGFKDATRTAGLTEEVHEALTGHGNQRGGGGTDWGCH
jgi:hypothetical protein